MAAVPKVNVVFIHKPQPPSYINLQTAETDITLPI
jgi:hypothetical protein